MTKITCLIFKSYTVHTTRIELTNVARVYIQYGHYEVFLFLVVVALQPAILRMRSVDRF